LADAEHFALSDRPSTQNPDRSYSGPLLVSRQGALLPGNRHPLRDGDRVWWRYVFRG